MRRINNIRISGKLVLLVALCVLLPFCSLSTAVLRYFYTERREYQKNSMQNILSRYQSSIELMLDQCAAFGNTLFRSQSLNHFMATEYRSDEDYLRTLNAGNRIPLLQNKAVYEQIGDICAYADNPSMLDGYDGYYVLTDQVRQSGWYQKVKSRSPNTQLITYVGNNEAGGQRLVLSLVTRLNYLPYGNKVEKYLKQDMDLNVLMYAGVPEEENGAYMFLVNEQNEILISNYPLWRENTGTVKSIDEFPLPDKYVSQTGAGLTDHPEYRLIRWEPQISIWQILNSHIGWFALLILANLLIPTVIIVIVTKSFKGRIDKLLRAMNEIGEGSFVQVDFAGDADEIGLLAKGLNASSGNLKHLVEEVYTAQTKMERLEKEKAIATYRALKSQIDPHFLFNTFELIRMRSVLKNETETARAIRQLAMLFRRMLDWENDIITIKEELSFIDDYIDIQNYISKYPTEYNVWCDEAALGAYLPKLTILTFIENSFVHGFGRSKPDKQIQLTIQEKKERVSITIIDNGKGISQESMEKIRRSAQTGIAESNGISNVLARLRMQYSDAFSFEVSNRDEGGTKVCFEIPLYYGDGEQEEPVC